MNDFASMVVRFSKEEFFALRDIAQKEYRHPRDQARYILRRALLDSRSHLYLDADVTPSEAATMILAALGPVYVNELIDALIDTFEIQPGKDTK